MILQKEKKKTLQKRFWAQRVISRPGSRCAPYEILNKKKPNLEYFYVFGCVCYKLNDRDLIQV